MAWWNAIGDIFKGGKQVAEVFVENKEAKGQRQHDEKIADIGRDLASLDQFAAEFQSRQKGSKWDSFVDGLNRLPRPLLTFAIISFFVLAPLFPERFFQIAKAYEVMPPGYWALLSVIIGFYFGGRMQLKAQDFTIKKSTVVTAAKELVAIKKEFRQIEDELEPVESKLYDIAVMEGRKAPKNKVVERWLKERKSTAADNSSDLVS
ncbi:MAG: carboxylesterase [Pseudomonadales bacterium]|nr:carboxylesterase [Pseudomonadales bacterium]